MKLREKELSLYEKLGIDPDKSSVRETFDKVNEQEFRGAFVNIMTDLFDRGRAMTQHQDGDGSKFIQRLLHFYETGDASIFRGMVDDALSMNTGDIAAAGFVGPYVLTDVLNLGLLGQTEDGASLKDIIMKQIALRFLELKELYNQQGIELHILGGETADLPDQVKSGVFDIAITAWADKEGLITGNVKPGDVIFGFASDGQAAWEEKPNSGLMSNGLTSARSSLMYGYYNYRLNLQRDKKQDQQFFYKGRFEVSDKPRILGGLSVSEAILSPTRQWALVINKIIAALQSVDALHMLHGITMNTGGGATKIKRLGSGGIHYSKVMPPPPPIFRLIQKESGEKWSHMYRVFNCGIGIDVVGENNLTFSQAVQLAARESGIHLFKIGDCRSAERENEVTLITKFGEFNY